MTTRVTPARPTLILAAPLTGAFVMGCAETGGAFGAAAIVSACATSVLKAPVVAEAALSVHSTTA